MDVERWVDDTLNASQPQIYLHMSFKGIKKNLMEAQSSFLFIQITTYKEMGTVKQGSAIHCM